MKNVHKKRQERGDEPVPMEVEETATATAADGVDSEAGLADEAISNDGEVAEAAPENNTQPSMEDEDVEELPEEAAAQTVVASREEPTAAPTPAVAEATGSESHPQDEDSDDSSLASDEEAEYGAPWVENPKLTEATTPTPTPTE